jgi:hypothetical protein
LATNRRCHANSVAGVTMKDRQRVRGSSRLAAARKIRSAHVIGGRLDRRRRIASSWRSTTISKSLKSVERRRMATS